LSGCDAPRKIAHVSLDRSRVKLWGSPVAPGSPANGTFEASGPRPDGVLAAPAAPNNLPPGAIAWIATRLGELKERRAAGTLARQFATGGYQVTRRAQEALIRIGGSEAASAARAVLNGKGPANEREATLNILYGLHGPAALPDIRKAVPDSALRTTALNMLAEVGTAEDLKTLAPMAGFWTGDREWHYWLMLATGRIRERNPN
jgi:hypothetical protein